MNKKFTILAGTAAMLLALTACSGGGGGGGTDDAAPIAVGSVNALSGPAIFPRHPKPPRRFSIASTTKAASMVA